MHSLPTPTQQPTPQGRELDVCAIQGWRFCSHHSKMVDSATLDAMQVCACGIWISIAAR